jgi:hypothetical protein
VSIRALKKPFQAKIVAPTSAAASESANVRRKHKYVPRNPSAANTTSVARTANTGPPIDAASCGNAKYPLAGCA